MELEVIIRKIVDYILFNINSVKLTGLYNGKAGLSLSLFVASRYLHDENIENRAFELLQKQLIIRNRDLSFQNGLSGTGYVLLYLIEHGYLEADFDEIFGEQHTEIVENFNNIEKDPLKLMNSLQFIFYLSKVINLKKKDEKLQKIIKKIFESIELYLTIQFYDFADIRYIGDKTAILNTYETYLKLVDYSGYKYFSSSLLNNYAELYRKGRITSSLTVGFYMNIIANKYNIHEYADIIEDNTEHGIKNIYSDFLSLKERVDLIRLIANNEKNVENVFLLELKTLDEGDIIRNLIKLIDKNSSPYGYEGGLGRFLLFCIDKQSEIL